MKKIMAFVAVAVFILLVSFVLCNGNANPFSDVARRVDSALNTDSIANQYYQRALREMK